MEPVTLRPDESVLLVDTSYYVFYRFFATAKWMALQTKPPPLPVVPDGAPVYSCELPQQPIAPLLNLANPAFRAAFIKHMDADIAKLKKTHGLAKASRNIVFCRDCYRREIWRTDIFPEYKGARLANRTFDPAAFQAVYAHVQETGYPMVWHPALEADDVAYLVHERIRSMEGVGSSPREGEAVRVGSSPREGEAVRVGTSPREGEAVRVGTSPRVIFITSDHDYLQIKDERNAIYQMDGKDVYEMGLKKGTCDIELKILKGDKSDNIAPVLTPAQIRKYRALDAAGRAALLDALGKREAYERNRALMHWGCIPAALRDGFNAAFLLSWAAPTAP